MTSTSSSIALGRVALRAHQARDLRESVTVIALCLDRCDVHDFLPSNGLRVDPVVLLVRADEPDIDDPIGIINPYHNTILVAGDVEHRTTVLENARAANGSLHVRGRRPVSRSDLSVPSHHWLARVGVTRASTEEDFKRTDRNDPHANKPSIVPDRDQGSFVAVAYFDFGMKVNSATAALRADPKTS